MLSENNSCERMCGNFGMPFYIIIIIRKMLPSKCLILLLDTDPSQLIQLIPGWTEQTHQPQCSYL